MLTPAELLNGVSQNHFQNSRPETNNIDIHIHTFLHPNNNNNNLPENQGNHSFYIFFSNN